MRIESIKLKNYRQLVNAKIEFPDIYDNDIHVVIGSNGTGKTTLLNAINWCLYGKEPHIFSEEEGLPLINTQSLENNEDTEISVEIKVNINDDESYIYSRKMDYNDVTQKQYFEIYQQINGLSKIIAQKDNETYVNKFVNELIKEFYFFDGEKLDDYFKKDNIGKIKNNVLKVSNIEKLIKMEDHLKTKIKEYNKKSKNKYSNIDELVDKVDNYDKKIKNTEHDIEEIENNLSNYQIRKSALDEELQGYPNINEVKKTIDKIQKRLDDKKEVLDESMIKRDKLNYTSAPSIFLYEPIKAVIAEIEHREEQNQLPPPVDEIVLSKSIKRCQCEVCKTDLDENKLEYLKQVLKEYELSNSDTKLLRKLELPLNNNLNKIERYDSRSKDIIKDQKRLEKEINELEDDKNENKRKILGVDDEVISKKYKEKLDLETDIEDYNRELGRLRQMLDSYQKELDLSNRQLDKAMENDEQTKMLKAKKKLCEDSLKVVDKTKAQIMTRTRENIEEYTNTKFAELLWKKETYSNISIDDKYNLQLYHSSGRKALGSASAAERALLALSYTLGIHSVSGYNSPLIIDTPLSRVSDEHKKNFSESLIKISKNKQIILLFTPDEFQNIQRLYEEFPHYDIVLAEDEQSSDIRVRGDY